MISIVPIGAVVRWVAVCYAALVALGVVLFHLVGHDLDFLGNVKLALAGALPLQVVTGFVVVRGWRRLWRWFPGLGERLFPDLNGRWAMTIHWTYKGQAGSQTAQAVVKQDLMRISMDVTAMNSDSQTLSVVPKRDPESGRPMLHYLYRVTPHAIGPDASPPYEGAAILRLDHDRAMHGNYWTSSPSTGHFNLTRAP